MSTLTPNSLEWEEMRKDKIGASDAPVIMGVSPYDTPYSLWQKKLDLLPKTEMSYPMERGHRLEPLAREQIEQRLGQALRPQVKFHASISWMMATLDGLSEDEKTLVEIKCPGKEDHMTAQLGYVPDKYFPQLQHQLEVCQLEKGFYFSFDGSDGVMVEFYRDDRYIKNLIKVEEEFYRCLQNLEEPPMTERDFQQIEDPMWLDLASHYQHLTSTLSCLEKEQKELKEKLISFCNGRNTMGGGIKISKCLRKGSIDYGKIPELSGLNLEPYRKKSTEYWRVV